MTRRIWIGLAFCAALLPSAALADDGVSAGLFTANNVWMMLAAGLVFVMHLGFASLESGLTRAKNTVNILFKNVFIICAGILTYWAVGFNLMYPGEFSMGSFFGFAGFGIERGNRPGRYHVRAYSRRRLHVLDGLPFPSDVRGYSGHDRLRGRGRAYQARSHSWSLLSPLM